uniref:Uncharacterized protein n=1 Tax=Amphimedon queenslandica TaxID=400682 RepID=A0A1X7T8E1_AMPQE
MVSSSLSISKIYSKTF